MKYGMAIEIIENLDKHTDEEIGLAIQKILSMETINAVTKDNLLKIVRYLFSRCYEVEKGGVDDDR